MFAGELDSRFAGARNRFNLGGRCVWKVWTSYCHTKKARMDDELGDTFYYKAEREEKNPMDTHTISRAEWVRRLLTEVSSAGGSHSRRVPLQAGDPFYNRTSASHMAI